jgi:hypothetical protein
MLFPKFIVPPAKPAKVANPNSGISGFSNFSNVIVASFSGTSRGTYWASSSDRSGEHARSSLNACDSIALEADHIVDG